MKSRTIKAVAIILILLHLAVSVVHGQAHRGALVMLDRFGFWYVIIVITIAPLVAGALLLSRWPRLGAALLAASMLGGFVFGGWFHFIAPGSDNISEVHGPWRGTFAWTAFALAAVELIGFLTGLLIYFRGRHSNFISHPSKINRRP